MKINAERLSGVKSAVAQYPNLFEMLLYKSAKFGAFLTKCMIGQLISLTIWGYCPARKKLENFKLDMLVLFRSPTEKI